MNKIYKFKIKKKIFIALDLLKLLANLTVVSSEKIFKLSPESEKPESWLSGVEDRDDSLEDKFGDVVDDARCETADIGVETADLGVETEDLDVETADLDVETADLDVETADLGVETADGVDIVLLDCCRLDSIAKVRGDNDNLEGGDAIEVGVDEVSLKDWLDRSGNLPP